jgi:hypothetical protein
MLPIFLAHAKFWAFADKMPTMNVREHTSVFVRDVILAGLELPTTGV